MTAEVPIGVDKGEEFRRRLMRPGEVFLENAPDRGSDAISQIESMLDEAGGYHWPTADERVANLTRSGVYASVRKIFAFAQSGEFLKDYAGIVATPKPSSSNPR